MKKYIFLDIDGVLNDINTPEDAPYGGRGLNDYHLQQLKTLVDETGAEIILSSDWRFNSPQMRADFPNWTTAAQDWEYMNKAFEKNGLVITDIVEFKNCIRGQEISSWLKTQEEPYVYVILDDLPVTEFCVDQIPYLINTNYIVGLTWDNINDAKAILNFVDTRSIKYFFISGDIHGNPNQVANFVWDQLKTPVEESAIILLGDVGANYYLNRKDAKTKKDLNDLNIYLYCLRGNHESRVTNLPNMKLFYDKNVGGKVWIEPDFPNIRYFLDDGGLYTINNKSVLVVPGAYSVDKEYRLFSGNIWFPDEQLNENEQTHLLKLAANTPKVDYIFAHTCPRLWEYLINYLFLPFIDQSEIDKTTEMFLDSIISYTNYDHFYFGHFHDDKDFQEVKATMLYQQFIPLGKYLWEDHFDEV